MRISKSLLILVIFVLTASSEVSCRGAKYWAAYIPNEGSISIAIELVSTHAFLAEYDRFAVLVENGTEILRRKLFPDSGAMHHRTYIDVAQTDICSKGTSTRGSWILMPER